MFKYLFLTISVVLSVSVFSIAFSYSAENKNSQLISTNPQITNKNLGKVLIIYYSLSGNTREIALMIKEKTNADIYEIQTENEYPSSPMIYLTAKKQMNPKNYPKLKNDDMPDINQYDLIFIGGPVWWYTVPAPLLSFLSQVDFQGKNVISFATHGGNYGKFFEDFESKIKNAKVIRGKEFKKVLKTDKNILDTKISDWLINLNK
jgi:flavodoxin